MASSSNGDADLFCPQASFFKSAWTSSATFVYFEFITTEGGPMISAIYTKCDLRTVVVSPMASFPPVAF